MTSDAQFVDLYTHGDKDYAREVGKLLGLTGEALQNFKYTGYEHKMTYRVDMETGDTTLVKVDDKELKQ